jgi:putative intracellular protease/amidase
MSAPRILMVVSSCESLPGFPRATGYWIGEVTHFYAAAARRGIECDIASPLGGHPPLDQKSNAPRNRVNREFLADARLRAKLEDTPALGAVDLDRYRAIYFAGGHGAMGDFPSDPTVKRAAEAVHERGGILSAVCHGSCVLLGLQAQDGRALVAGRRVTGFANLEERLLGLRGSVPFALESELRAKGAVYRKALLPFVSHVEVDDRIFTGQNPQSPGELGERVAEALR